MNRLVYRTIIAWRAWQASREVARKRKAFARSHPDIIALSKQIEKKRRQHLPTRADTLQLSRKLNQALRGGQ